MKSKKVLVLGVGAQGSAAAKRLDLEPNVEQIICADRDKTAVDNLVKTLKKATGTTIDAHDKDSIVAAAKGVDLILNGLPLECTKNVLDAALEVKANYQDYAATTSLHEDWVESIRIQYDVYGPKFAEIGKLALVGTGSAPGLICAATRDAMRYLDSCDTIYNIVWEGAITKRFLPFWWSPVTALHDMSEQGYAFENGKLVRLEAFEHPIKRQYDYMDEEITFVEHCHDEPIHYSFNAEKFFKGAKNAYFKYAGAGVDFAKPLYRAGLLSHEKEKVGDVEVSPFDVVLKHIPPAPKFKEEIKEIIDEGLVCDSGCMVIEAYGKKDGKDVLVETHVSAPGLVESYERAGITAEMYLTGQGGFLFSKLFLNDEFDQTGLISSDMLTMDQVDTYFGYAKELGITLDTHVKEL
ncbi:MAG: saccharopine dehydrogenase NADP-binding domain-containing protein [Bacillota bacterium]|nr:saccharopine dehydrogenase NADP-binding domain-containing protein [Bacillota bacterium]